MSTDRASQVAALSPRAMSNDNSLCSTPPSAFGVVSDSDLSHSGRCAVVCHCCLTFSFLMTRDFWASVHRLVCRLEILRVEMSVTVFRVVPTWAASLIHEFQESFVDFGWQSFTSYISANILSQSVAYMFNLLRQWILIQEKHCPLSEPSNKYSLTVAGIVQRK